MRWAVAVVRVVVVVVVVAPLISFVDFVLLEHMLHIPSVIAIAYYWASIGAAFVLASFEVVVSGGLRAIRQWQRLRCKCQITQCCILNGF